MLNVIKVLIIEDNAADARLISEMLKEISKPRYELIHFTTLQEGIIYLDKHQVDILLLDLSLPDSMGGKPLKKHIKVHQKCQLLY